MSDKSADEHAPAPAPGPSKAPLLAAVMGLLNLGISGFIVTKVMHPTPAAAAAPAKAEDEAPVALPSVPLDPFVINLNEPGASRYLKASFEMELTSEKYVAQVTANKRVIRDELLRYLSSLTIADTLGEKGKNKIQEEVIARANKALGGDRVKHVYFTEFVVQ